MKKNKKKERKKRKKRERREEEEDRREKKKPKRNEDTNTTKTATTTKPSKKGMVPMTKEEYDKMQSVVRRVYDPDTGRMRLVKGSGEIIEEIVTRNRHADINRASTQGDGATYMQNLLSQIKR